MTRETLANDALTAGQHIALTEEWAAHNYHPLEVVISHGDGVWVYDTEGKKYLDCLAGYSALNFGHSHPRLIARAEKQLRSLTLTSRAFYNDQVGPFARDLAALCGKEMILPMNSGAEAVETALKVARRWGHQVKGIDENRGDIIVMDGNFHGRTTTIVSFSTDEEARAGYGPYTPGFTVVEYGNAEAISTAIGKDTIAVLLEPIQGEGGVIIPPEGYLQQVRELCSASNVLMIADEIQSGLGRSGTTFACDHEGVVPDMYILGKALGGGIMPVSAIAANTDILGVITPGSHGSTFGGNPLACAIGHEVVQMLDEGKFQALAVERGAYLAEQLAPLVGDGVVAIRSRGLWVGIDLDPELMSGRELCEALAERGVLAKDTHGSTIRLAPPLVIEEDELDVLVQALKDSITAARA